MRTNNKAAFTFAMGMMLGAPVAFAQTVAAPAPAPSAPAPGAPTTPLLRSDVDECALGTRARRIVTEIPQMGSAAWRQCACWEHQATRIGT